MISIKQGGNEMKFFGNSKKECSSICQHYLATKTITSEGVIDQYKCKTCNKYIFPGGIENSGGNRTCKCCGSKVIYIKSIKDDPDFEDTNQKIVSHSFTKQTNGMKTFSEFLEFIEDGMQLQANYQLVTLKFLIGKKMATKMEISEELAYQNNKNFNDYEEVEKFLSVPVFDVLENKGFIKKIHHHGKDQYLLNVLLSNFESDRSFEVLEKKLQEYNLEHGIPENQFDDIQNDTKIEKKNFSPNTYSEKIISNDNEVNFRICARCNETKIPLWNNSSICRDCVVEKETGFIIENEPVKNKETSQEFIESNGEKIIRIENSLNGIRLEEFSKIKSEEIPKGKILSNDDLIYKFGVGNMGGIRYSKKNNIIVLCSTLSDDYADVLDPNSGLIIYSGEGRFGDQELIKGNKKILDSESKMLYFKEKFQEPGSKKRGALDNLYEFMGIVKYVKHYWKDEKDKEGNERKVVKFVLEVEE